MTKFIPDIRCPDVLWANELYPTKSCHMKIFNANFRPKPVLYDAVIQHVFPQVHQFVKAFVRVVSTARSGSMTLVEVV